MNVDDDILKTMKRPLKTKLCAENFDKKLTNAAQSISELKMSISNLEMLRDKYLIYIKEFDNEFNTVKDLYDTFRKEKIRDSLISESSDIDISDNIQIAAFNNNSCISNNSGVISGRANPISMPNTFSQSQQEMSNSSSFGNNSSNNNNNIVFSSPNAGGTPPISTSVTSAGVPDESLNEYFRSSLQISENEPISLTLIKQDFLFELNEKESNGKLDKVNIKSQCDDKLVSEMKQRYVLKTSGIICSAQFDPKTGKTIAFSDGNNIFVVNSENGALIHSLEIPKTLNRTNLYTRILRFSPSGEYLASTAMMTGIAIYSYCSSPTSLFSSQNSNNGNNINDSLNNNGTDNGYMNGQVNMNNNNNSNNDLNDGNRNNTSCEGRRFLGVLKGHKNTVSSFIFLEKKEKVLISGAYDGKLCIWDYIHMKLIKEIQHGPNNSSNSIITSFSTFSEDNSSINNNSNSNSINNNLNNNNTNLNDANSMNNSQTNNRQNLLKSNINEGAIVSLAVDSNETMIIVAFLNGSIGIYEPTFTQPMNIFIAHSGFLLNAQILHDDTSIVSTSQDRTCKLWTLRGIASCKYTFTGHTDYVLTSCHNRQNNRLLITGGKDEMIKGWDLVTGECLFTLKCQNNSIFEVDHHPLEKCFVSSSGDGTICVWDYK